MSTQLIKKISGATLGFDKKSIRTACEKEPVTLYTVYGLALDVKEGTGDMGDFVKFVGQFEAVNSITGEVFRSATLFLPDAISVLLEAQVNNGKANESFKGVQFAFEIGAEYSAKSATEYEFTVVDLMPESDADILGSIRRKYVENKVEAPKETKAKEKAKEKAKTKE